MNKKTFMIALCMVGHSGYAASIRNSTEPQEMRFFNFSDLPVFFSTQPQEEGEDKSIKQDAFIKYVTEGSTRKPQKKGEFDFSSMKPLPQQKGEADFQGQLLTEQKDLQRKKKTLDEDLQRNQKKTLDEALQGAEKESLERKKKWDEILRQREENMKQIREQMSRL